jgi:hypothetical protein
MFPIQMIAQLRQELEGRILDDIQWPGWRPVDLAPLCGRQIMAVRLFTGQVSQISVQLEWPVFDDEPSGFLFRVDDVQRVWHQKRLGSQTLVLNLVFAGGSALLVHSPLDGRLAYESMVAELSDLEVAAVRWAATVNSGRLPQSSLAQFLGIDVSRARELSVVWTRSGLLESGGGRGHPRLVTERALALAGLS